ncbi:hypothetical protein AB0C11_10705 [Streptomyces sp. NPDC039016]|uniref:hypothetical protein n=1 Tax=Streptomyces sp. NPDC039016 TaxID=3154330 RepID=UPI00340269DB
MRDQAKYFTPELLIDEFLASLCETQPDRSMSGMAQLADPALVVVLLFEDVVHQREPMSVDDELSQALWRCAGQVRKFPEHHVHQRLWVAAMVLRGAATPPERRAAARVYLEALAELVSRLLQFVARVLLLLLSRALGRAYAEDVPVWQPEPIDETPQIAPRGPNHAFPVPTHRGGHHRSALGSAVLAA